MATSAAKLRARAALAQLARAELDNDSFRQEAAAILRRAVGFDGWCWLLADPVARLPTREIGEHMVVDQAMRRFLRMMPEAWDKAGEHGGQRPRRKAAPVTVLSTDTRGDLRRDLSWREVFGPAGVGDKMTAQFMADGVCWGLLHLNRDSSSGYYSEEDADFVSDVMPLLAARLRDGQRTLGRRDDRALGPGTIILDQDLSLVAATEEAWWWIDRLGLPRLNQAEPLPGVVYVVATYVAASSEQPPGPAQVRLQATDGRWVTVRAAPLIGGAQTDAGYAITLEPACSEDLAPLLMRAWELTPRERQVARLVIDGLSGEEIARALFISAHTARGHLKMIFSKIGVTRRQDLVGVLTAGTRPAAQCQPYASPLLPNEPRRPALRVNAGLRFPR